jgi:SAM-dependent methyltransferase
MSDVPFDLRLPKSEQGLPQDEEYCILSRGGKEQKVRFHDYDQIYKIPGLYEHLFYETLQCTSHVAVPSLLLEQIGKAATSPHDLTVLELGAGNGLVGEALAERGIESLVGVDILEEAAEAAQRDRPDLYDRYYVKDLCNLDSTTLRELEESDFNCMVCVAALGFGDIPTRAFVEAYNLVSDGGWIAFNIKEDFVSGDDSTGFAHLIRLMIEGDAFDLRVSHPYHHRLAIDGQPLTYLAMVGRKLADIGHEQTAFMEHRVEAQT